MSKTRATYSALSQSLNSLTKSIDSFSEKIEKLIDTTIDSKKATEDLVKTEEKSAKEEKKSTEETKKTSENANNVSKKGFGAKPYSFNRLKTGNLGSNPIAGVANGLLDGIASLGGPLGTALFNVLKSVGEFAIGKMSEYMTVGYENQMRALNAITTANVNTMKANLGLWTDSLTGAYEAQNLSMSSNLAMIEAQNATDLANKKLQYSWGKDIIFLNSYLDMKAKEMEMEQKIQETRLKNAQETIQAGEEYAKKADEYGKKQDAIIRNYTRSIGLSEGQTKIFEKRALALNSSLAGINATMEDALKIQMDMQQQSGRLIGFSNEDYLKSTAVGQIMGPENVARFESEMVIFNKSVADSTSIMEDMYQYANTMGLSQKKLTQNVLNNLKLANKYQFKGGVKGFIEFAKWAENVRFNVAQLGSMIEKIQTGGLEGVIKQSAQLQVLGGGFAMNADPLRMAFNAFQDPESLAKDFYNALRSEGLFDTKTGELTQGIASQMRLRAASQAYGFSYEDARTMIRERTRKENAKSQLRSTNFSEDEKDAIANIAQRDKNGQWFVNTLSGKKGLGEVTKEDIASLLSNNAQEDMVKYAAATLPLTQQIESNTKSIDALLGGRAFDNLTETVKKTTDITLNGFTQNIEHVNNAIEMVRDASIDAINRQMDKLATLDTDIADAYQVQKEANDNIGNIYKLLLDQYKISKEKKDYKRAADDAYEQVKATKLDFSKYKFGSQEYYDALQKNREAQYKHYLAQYAQSKNKKKNSKTWVAKWYHQADANSYWDKSKAIGKQLGLSEEQIEKELSEARHKYELNGEDSQNNAGQAQQATTTNDAFASAGGTPMAIAAKDITSIHDGLAMADKRDSAVFAKTGGPFDRLFNGVFNKVNAIYDTIQHPEKIARMTPVVMKTIQEMPQKLVAIGEDIKQNAVGGNNNPIKFEPLKIEMNGKLELSSGGNSVDIMSELQNNPLLVREIAKMISDSLSSKLYGGKSRLIPGQNSYFS